MKQTLFAVAAMAIASTACADILIADFEAIPPYSGPGTQNTEYNIMRDTAVISTVPGTTGNAMQCVYDLKGETVAAGSGYRSWTLPSPCFGSATNTDYLDLSGAQGFSVRVKVTAAETMNNSIFFYVTDRFNRSMRMNLSNMLTDTGGAWRDLKVPFATQFKDHATVWPGAPFGYGMQSTPWAFGGSAIDLANVKSVTVNMYDTAGTTADRNVTFAFDDLYAFTGEKKRNDLAKIDFNDYADIDEIKNDWKVCGYTPNAVLTQVTCSDGKKAVGVQDTALKLYESKGIEHTFAAPIDMSLVSYVAVEMEGDVTYASYNGLLQVLLYDTAATELFCNIYMGPCGNVAEKTNTFAMLSNAGWIGMVVPEPGTGPAYSGSIAWRKGSYAGNAAANANFNLGAVKRVRLIMSPQGGTIPSPAPAATVKIRKVEFGKTAALPTWPAAVSDYAQF